MMESGRAAGTPPEPNADEATPGPPAASGAEGCCPSGASGNGPSGAQGGGPSRAKGKRYAFPREARILRKRDFEAAFETGGKAVCEALVVYARANGLERNRLGRVVGKKLGNAVRRNRIRRLLREAFRLETPEWPQGFDFVVIPRPGGFPDSLDLLRTFFSATARRAVSRVGRPGEIHGKRNHQGRGSNRGGRKNSR